MLARNKKVNELLSHENMEELELHIVKSMKPIWKDYIWYDSNFWHSEKLKKKKNYADNNMLVVSISLEKGINC